MNVEAGGGGKPPPHGRLQHQRGRQAAPARAAGASIGGAVLVLWVCPLRPRPCGCGKPPPHDLRAQAAVTACGVSVLLWCRPPPPPVRVRLAAPACLLWYVPRGT